MLLSVLHVKNTDENAPFPTDFTLVSAADGSLQAKTDEASWFDYLGRTFNQLIWWGQAEKEHRTRVDPHKMACDFKRDPSERNAP